KFRLSGLDRLERHGAIGNRQLVEGLSTTRLETPSVEVGNAYAVEIGGRQRQMVALLRRTLAPRAIKIQARAAATGGGRLAIDEHRHADFDSAGTNVVLRNQGINQGNDDCGLWRSEEPEGVSGLAIARHRMTMRLRCGLCLGLVNPG